MPRVDLRRVTTLALAGVVLAWSAESFAQVPAEAPPKGEGVGWVHLDLVLRGGVAARSQTSARGSAVFGMSIDWIVRSAGLVNARAKNALWIGGGGNGFEGLLAPMFSYGIRLPKKGPQGVIARAGVSARIEGNDGFLTSNLQLPQAQLGYQLVTKSVAFEIAGTGAPVLAGYYKAGGSRPLDGSFSWGGVLTAMTRPMSIGDGTRDLSGLRLDVEYLRVHAQSTPGSAVDQLRSSLCIADILTLCVDGALLHGDVISNNAPIERTVFYGGISLGAGVVFADKM